MITTMAPPRTQDLGVQRPTRDVVVVRAAGELDLLATPEFADVLDARLDSATRAVVVDLSQLSFLCATALQALVEAQLRARAQGFIFRLVTGPRCVASALRAAGLLDHLETFPSQAAALSDLGCIRHPLGMCRSTWSPNGVRSDWISDR